MAFKVGDKVRATVDINDGEGSVAKGTKGTVVHVMWSVRNDNTLLGSYPYDVAFYGYPQFHLVAPDEIELLPMTIRQRIRAWWNATNPLDAEKDFGTEETFDAFKALQEEAGK